MQLTNIKNNDKKAALILSAALLLPGITPKTALAENAPEHAMVGFKYLQYRDWQPGLDRIRVKAPSFYGVLPISGKWSLEGSATADSLSGASPRWHTAVSGASIMHDYRKAYDIKGTRYFERASISLSASSSKENDYNAKSVALAGTFSSEDNNRTFAWGIGRASDKINPVNKIVENERKRTTDLLLGFTQVLTPTDIAQINMTYAKGSGYYSDPYKLYDNRPRSRNQLAVKTSWNHYVSAADASLRTSYRFYNDTFRVRAHTFQAEWVQPWRGSWTFTPLIRIHSQSAAKFYYDPVYSPSLGEPLPPGYKDGDILSSDQRLAAFGGRTIGLKAAVDLGGGWSADARFDYYVQRANYRLLGTGSPGLDPFKATFFQLGGSKKFN